MRDLTTRELLGLTGLPAPTLLRWVDEGVVRPAVRGRDGRGIPHRFAPGAAFAVFVAAKYRAENAGPDRVVGVLRYLAGETLERLEAAFEDGRTFPVPAALANRAAREEGLGEDVWLPGMMVEMDPDGLPPRMRALMKRLYLPRLLEEFRVEVENLSPRKAGRRRGLPGGAKKASKG